MVYRVGTKKPIPVETALAPRDRLAIERACAQGVPAARRDELRLVPRFRGLTARVQLCTADGPDRRCRPFVRLTYLPEQAAWTATYGKGSRWRDRPEVMGSLGLVLRRTLEDHTAVLAGSD